MTQPVQTAVSSQADRGWCGHPRGLSTLLFTEMWERFSFYGLRALLVLYMTAAVTQGGLAFPTDKATSIVGWYGFGVYAAAIPGGWIADRFLGQFRSVFIGGGIIALRPFRHGVPGGATFFFRFALVVMGGGRPQADHNPKVGAALANERERGGPG